MTTCEKCIYSKRVGDAEHIDYCYQSPGAPEVRQRSTDYWPDYPLACSKRDDGTDRSASSEEEQR